MTLPTGFDEFLAELLGADVPDWQVEAYKRFTAPPCTPHTMAAPRAEKLHGQYPRIIIIDEAADFAEPYFPEEVSP